MAIDLAVSDTTIHNGLESCACELLSLAQSAHLYHLDQVML